ncbi:MAG TPA: penicillin-binding transpeptidase domain-containing protein [Candidatus Acidoferrales bacterium]|nr:penicillin-binding transpeptidase domain-containing protein [Candidatus Acidoferrales bacterium]
MSRTLILALLLACSAVSGADLNSKVTRIMDRRSGTAIVADVRYGKLLAFYRPDIAARRLVRPGSAFKPFVLLALLGSGKLKPTESLVCIRNLHVGNHDLSCSHPPTGPLDATEALAYSCNDFFATFGLRLSAAELQDAFDKAGFASPTGFLPGEAEGSIRRAQTDEERQLQAVGEGELRITPLEMLAAYRTLALRRTNSATSATDEAVFAGLEQSAAYGMARLAAIPVIKVAGKTGTPQAEDGSWTHGWFAGYAPADKPEIVVVVFLERGDGPGDAAPLASEIFRAWYMTSK